MSRSGSGTANNRLFGNIPAKEHWAIYSFDSGFQNHEPFETEDAMKAALSRMSPGQGIGLHVLETFEPTSTVVARRDDQSQSA